MARFLSVLLVAMMCHGAVSAATVKTRRKGVFVATAFAQRGITRSGIRTRRGLVAADTRVLPLGTRIQVGNAGRYSGTYTVADTGSLIRGRRIDIFEPDLHKARLFGKKPVRVRVLRWGRLAANRSSGGCGTIYRHAAEC
jgi:3D (Asp-Asp-Asp) domain-containing protein